MTNIADVIPVCPECRRVLIRCTWARHPHAHCEQCGKTYFYDQNGDIRPQREAGTVTIRKVA